MGVFPTSTAIQSNRRAQARSFGKERFQPDCCFSIVNVQVFEIVEEGKMVEKSKEFLEYTPLAKPKEGGALRVVPQVKKYAPDFFVLSHMPSLDKQSYRFS